MIGKRSIMSFLITPLVFALTFSQPVFSEKSKKEKSAKTGKKKKKKKAAKKNDTEKKPLDPEAKEAKEHFQKGVNFFSDGNYSAALAEFLKSFEIVPKFSLRYNIGICYLETGKLVKALEQFQKYFEEGGEKVPDETRKEVEKMMKEIEDKLGYLELECSVDDADIELDDFTKYVSPVTDPIPLKAGMHTLRVKKTGFDTFKKEFSIASGETKTLMVKLKEIKAAPAVSISEEEDIKPDIEKKTKKKPKRWLWLALGGGGALGAATAVTGGLVLKKRSDMEDEVNRCDITTSRDACPKAYEAKETGEQLRLATNILAGVAGAVAITGLILFILDKPKALEKEPDEKEKKVSSRIFFTGGSNGSHSYLGFHALLSF